MGSKERLVWGSKDLHVVPRSASLSPGALGRSWKETLRFSLSDCKVGGRISSLAPYRAPGFCPADHICEECLEPFVRHKKLCKELAVTLVTSRNLSPQTLE